MLDFWYFFFSSRRRHTRFDCDWSSDVCSSDLSQAPHVMMRLDRDRWAAERRGGLDDVGIQRSLHQESDVPGHVFGRRLEDVDERVADAAPLLFRVFDPRQHFEKARPRVDEPQLDAEVCPERPFYLLALVEA